MNEQHLEESRKLATDFFDSHHEQAEMFISERLEEMKTHGLAQDDHSNHDVIRQWATALLSAMQSGELSENKSTPQNHYVVLMSYLSITHAAKHGMMDNPTAVRFITKMTIDLVGSYVRLGHANLTNPILRKSAPLRYDKELSTLIHFANINLRDDNVCPGALTESNLSVLVEHFYKHDWPRFCSNPAVPFADEVGSVKIHPFQPD